MKQLKNKTLKSYNLTQLINHLNRYMNYHYNVSPFRFIYESNTYVNVFGYCEASRAYYFEGIFNKKDLIDLIFSEKIYI